MSELSERNGKKKYLVINFFRLTKKAKIVLALEDTIKTIYISMELLSLYPELFHNRSNLYMMEFTEAQIEKIIETQAKYEIKLKIMTLLVKKDYSSRKLALMLEKYEFDTHLFKKVIEELKEKGYLNEEKSIREYIDYYLHQKLYGRELIRKRLVDDKLYNEDLVDALLSEIPSEEFHEAAEKIKKNYTEKVVTNRFQMQNKVRRNLINRGFSEEYAIGIADTIGYSKNERQALLNDLEKLKRKFKNVTGKKTYHNKIVENLQRKGYNFFFINQVFPKEEE